MIQETCIYGGGTTVGNTILVNPLFDEAAGADFDFVQWNRYQTSILMHSRLVFG